MVSGTAGKPPPLGLTFRWYSKAKMSPLKLRWLYGIRLPSVTARFGTIPLWLPFLAIATPTTILWYFDRPRRVRPGHCQHCGYDLTGNTSGICPECGTPSLANQ